MEDYFQNQLLMATQIFPMEIWDQLLDELTTVADMQNLFQACPELSTLSKDKRFSRRIAELMPLVLPKYLTFEDILNCRLVSKRWKNTIDEAILENPNLTPYKSSAMAKVREYDFNLSLGTIQTKFRKFVELGIHNVYLNPGKNPFPGRYLQISTRICSGAMLGERELDELDVNSLTDAVPALQGFGHHIWYLSVTLVGGSFDERSMAELVRQLSHCFIFLPNLKSFRLETFGTPMILNRPTRRYAFPKAFVVSTGLETLDLTQCDMNTAGALHYMFVTSFVRFAQVKKFATTGKNWHTIYGGLFPELSELSLDLRLVADLEQILTSLRSPKLRKLEVNFSEVIMMTELLEVLVPYQIESLDIYSEGLSESIEAYHGEHSLKHVIVSSMKDLKIAATPRLSFHFLKSLPLLEYLTVDLHSTLWNERNQDEYGLLDERFLSKFGKSLASFRKDHQFEPRNFERIWKELPKLKMLTIHLENHVTKRYVRECKHQVLTAFKGSMHFRRTRNFL